MHVPTKLTQRFSNEGERPSRQANKIYYMAYEGATEEAYFSALNNYGQQQGLGILIQIRPLSREYCEGENSNPETIVRMMLDKFDSWDEGTIKVEEITNQIDNWLREERIIPDKKSFPNAHKDIRKKLGHQGYPYYRRLGYDEITDEFLEILCKCVGEVIQYELTEYKIIEFKKRLDEEALMKKEEGDKACLVVDRDPDSFKEYQYDRVLETCENNDIDFYVTNPCFEFWLLLHYDEVFTLDPKQLLENPFTCENPYTHKMDRMTLCKAMEFIPGYRKSNIHFDELKGRINKAIENEKKFCEDRVKLKNELGSNVGLLIKEMWGG